MAKFFMTVLVGALALIAAADVTWAACNPGSKNCVTPNDPNRPTRCGGPTNPCTIDGSGLGSECKGGGITCGLPQQGPVTVVDPSGRKTTSNGKLGTAVTSGARRH
jgi:hypothetical protein